MRFSLLSGTVLVVAGAVTLWGCGSGSMNASPTSPSGSPAAPGGSSASTIVNVLGQNGARSFSPNPSTINQGDMVSWHNSDRTTHHIVLNDGSLDTGDIAPGASSAALRLATNGANYHCTIHPDMVGSINATTGAPPPCTGPYC